MIRRVLWLALLAAAPAQSLAQVVPAPPAPQRTAPALPEPKVGPRIEQIATASAVSTEPLGTITSVRELPDGRVLVNDGTRRRLLLMDTTLTTVAVVLDSLSEIANTYGTRPGGLLPFRGDTVLFVDPVSYAIVVIDPDGRMVRVRSVWRAQETMYYSGASTFYGVPGLDAKGRIVYRIRAVPGPPSVRPPAGVPYFPPDPDSMFIVAADLDTRRIDTIGVVRTPRQDMRVRLMPSGGYRFEMVMNPLPLTDDWAVLSDGTVAFVRGRDYRVDYLNPDGSITSSEKLPYDWQRLLDDDKEQLVDSVTLMMRRNYANSYTTAMIRWVNMYGRGYPVGFTVPDGYVLPPGLPRDWILPQGVTFPANYNYACPPGVEPTMPAGVPMVPPGAVINVAGGAPGAGAPNCMPAPILFSSGTVPQPPTMSTAQVLPPSELPDYRPPFAANAVRADMDGNLWIRINPPHPSGAVYDIVNRSGELVTRYQLPPGYTIVGFGRGKIVYLSMRDQTGIHLARVRLR
ncbi:MAG TPA: hypothetical protein VMN60_09660 [Longimicrobiales bacterium]|nr:hypothetical protein [Longimicrobiales bacterium]